MVDGEDPKLNILALSPNAWDGPWMNRQHLLSRLGAIHHVVYTTGLLSAWQRGTATWRSATWAGCFERRDAVDVDHPSKALLRLPSLRRVDKAMLRFGAARWKRQLQRHGRRPLVAHVFHPMFYECAEALSPDHLVFHAYDLYEEQPGWTAALASWQSKLLRESHLIVASSPSIALALQKAAERPVHTVLNGVDFDRFAIQLQAADEPADLSEIPHPRIGYIGNINRKVDLGLVASLAVRRPSWQFVLVGGLGVMDAQNDRALESCRGVPNIHFLGHKTHHELPSYVGAMDVNLMCYRTSDARWTSVSYPLKLHEYLASGKPVVSVALPDLRRHADVLAFAHTVDEWQAAIDDAIEGRGPGSPQMRRAVASANSWDKRVDQMAKLLSELAQGNGSQRLDSRRVPF